MNQSNPAEADSMLITIVVYFGIGALYALINSASIRSSRKKTGMKLWFGIFVTATCYPLIWWMFHEK